MSWRRFNLRQDAPALSSGLRRCSAQKPAPCPVVVIDEDDDGGGSDSEVLILDGAAGKASSRSQARKGDGSSGNVINLDDEEEEEVSPGDKAGPSTTRRAGSTAAKTTPGRASGPNRYGLDSASDCSESDVSEGEDTESESDEDTASDCEIMDDSRGTARKMWETAASSRKKMPSSVHKSNEGMSTASTSSSGSDTRPKENAEGIFGPGYNLDDDILRFFQDAYPETCPSTASEGPAEFNWNGNMHFSDGWKGEQSSSRGAKDGHGHGPSTVPDAKDCSNGNVSNGKETDYAQNSHGVAKGSRAGCRVNDDVSQYFSHTDEEGTRNTTGAAKDDCDPSPEQNAMECPNRSVPSGDGPDDSRSSTLDSNAPCNAKTADFHNGDVPEKASGGIRSPHLDQTFVDTFVSAKRVFPANCSPDWKNGSPSMEEGAPKRMGERIPEGICLSKDRSSLDAHNVLSGGCSVSQDLVDDPKGLGQFTLVQDASNFENGLIGDREKHKETEEFKRAAEQEWASRQRQLQIEAEEVQRLRKRKKAQALRLLEMEKNQKQRLEEVRRSHKKNEEEIQLKEQYRCVVRKELEDTESRYKDTRSILRVLGIPVEGREVRTALKLAQVKFHPDRVSRSDIYQQVKAEETFKFISRLKEKLPGLR